MKVYSAAMKKLLIGYMLVILLGMMGHSLRATHIVGAELYYECLDPQTNAYRVTLKMYRDCFRGQAPFDDPLYLFLFAGDSSGQLITTQSVPKPPLTPRIQPANWDSCVGTPNTICVEEGIYTTIMTLPPRRGGYNIAWARCCRNSAITNLANPLSEGVSFLAHVPDSALATCNSMPVFRNTPPIFLCANKPFYFDHSAADGDGDSLVYRLTDPYTGLDLLGRGAGNPTLGGPSPVVDPIFNPMWAPPYRNVIFAGGYSFTDPFGSGNFVIDPQTGFLSVTPNRTGIFVMAISVFEYRNGVLLSENRRDFQIHVIRCLDQGAPPIITHDLSGLNSRNDTIFVRPDEAFCYPVTITDTNATDSLVAYTVSAPFGNGTFTPPLATFTFSGVNPINGTVCWKPACVYDGQTIPLIIGAKDINDCPNIADVFDTVYVKIEEPPNRPPTLSFNLNGLTVRGDTIFVDADRNFCFPFTVTDPDTVDSLYLTPVSPIFGDPNGPTVTFSGTNPIQGQICWKPACNLDGQTVRLELLASDRRRCNLELTDNEAVFVNISIKPNLPPQIISNTAGLSMSGDTILINAEQAFCIPFRVEDPNAKDSLRAVTISPIFQAPDGPTFSYSGTNPLLGQICWKPACSRAGEIIELVFEAFDNAGCNTQGGDLDTLLIKISIPPNRPPQIQTNISNNSHTAGDTIFIDAKEAFCFEVTLSDPDTGDTLVLQPVSPIFSAADGPTVTYSGNNPLRATVCWSPGCSYEGQLIPMVFNGEDRVVCNNNFQVADTIWVKISDPVSLPPILGVDLSGTQHNGDTIFVRVGRAACYTFYIDDRTPGNGINYSYQFQELNGRNLGYGTLNIVRSNDSILGKVCFSPNCADGGNTYRMVIQGIDKITCPPFATTERIIYIKVQTDFYALAGADLDFCEGSGGDSLRVVPFGGRAPYRFRWGCTDDPFCGFSNPFMQQIQVNPNKSTTYFVQITDADGCTSEIDSVRVTVKALPEADAGPDRFRCPGDAGIKLLGTVTNAADAPPPYQYKWTPGNSLNRDDIAQPFATPDTSTIYTLIVTSANGCTSKPTTLDTNSTVIVQVGLRPMAEAGPDTIICLGDSAPLLGQAFGAIGPYRYEWTPPVGLSDPTIADPEASPPHTFTYSLVTYSGEGCPSLADQATVFVRTLPTLNPGFSPEICQGDSIRLEALAGGDSTSSFTYQWLPIAGLDNSTSRSPVASPDSTENYRVQVTSDWGCTSKWLPVEVRVLATPLPYIGNDTTICQGDSLFLEGRHLFENNLPPVYSVFYEWMPRQALRDPDRPFTRDQWVKPERSTTYVVQVSHGSCVRNDSLTVYVLDRPNIGIEADKTRICSGDSVNLELTGLAPNQSVVWQPAEGLDRPELARTQASPQKTTTYYVSGKLGGCVFRDSVELWVNGTPDGDFQANALSGCVPFAFEATANPEAALAYAWQIDAGAAISNESSLKRTFTVPGRYELSLLTVGEGGCEATASRWLDIFPAPEADFITDPPIETLLVLPGADVAFLDLSQGAIRWMWEFGDGGSSTEEQPNYTYQAAGSYEVILTVSDSNGCVSQARKGPFVVKSPNLLIPNVFSPNQDGIHDRYVVAYDGNQPFFLQVFDRWGRLQYEADAPLPGWDGTGPSGAASATGVYYYVVKIGEEAYKGTITLLR
ncbi:MAG: PKD domain-containing protein [Bacteroidota bacterium]